MIVGTRSFDTLYFPLGAAIGLASAAPVGPVNLLVIQRTLTSHLAAGLMVGAGGAVGDSLFAATAAFGLGAISQFISMHQSMIRLTGGIIMLFFALFIWRSAPHLRSSEEQAPPLRTALATFTLTVTNPATLLFFAGAFGAVGFVGIGHATALQRLHAAMIVAGTFTGSMIWWLVLSATSRRLRERITDRHLVLLNRVTAIGLSLFALAAVLTGVMR